jgi:hypothetical protein
LFRLSCSIGTDANPWDFTPVICFIAPTLSLLPRPAACRLSVVVMLARSPAEVEAMMR